MKSIAAFALVALLSLIAIFDGARWRSYGVLTWDVAGYYYYLASPFISHDVGDGSFVSYTRDQYRPDMHNGSYGLVPAPNGKKVVKYTMGMALFYAPGFWIADTWVRLHGKVADGFAAPYQEGVALSCLTYAMLGLLLLRGILKRYFSDGIVAWTLLAIGIGTNLFCYSTYDAGMAHGTLFFLNTCLLLCTIRWHATYAPRWAFLLGIVLGLMVLVRPSELLMALVPLLWGVSNGAAARQRVRVMLQHSSQLLWAAAVFAAVISLQLLFWHTVGGAWFIDTYVGEKFDFVHPHILDGLFSSRKGWFVYTPMAVVALLGGWQLKRYVPAALPVLVVLVPIVVYVTFSWWDWGYGGGFSARPLISLYPLLSLPLAALLAKSRLSTVRFTALLAIVVLCIALNLLQTWQYNRGLLNCCDTTWQTYRERFFMLDWE